MIGFRMVSIIANFLCCSLGIFHDVNPINFPSSFISKALSPREPHPLAGLWVRVLFLGFGQIRRKSASVMTQIVQIAYDEDFRDLGPDFRSESQAKLVGRIPGRGRKSAEIGRFRKRFSARLNAL